MDNGELNELCELGRESVNDEWWMVNDEREMNDEWWMMNGECGNVRMRECVSVLIVNGKCENAFAPQGRRPCLLWSQVECMNVLVLIDNGELWLVPGSKFQV